MILSLCSQIHTRSFDGSSFGRTPAALRQHTSRIQFRSCIRLLSQNFLTAPSLHACRNEDKRVADSKQGIDPGAFSEPPDKALSGLSFQT